MQVSRVAATRMPGKASSSFRRAGIIVTFALWSALSSLFVFPHSLSYFNELAGGPLGGPQHLLGSNTDWGQNLLYLRAWLDEHAEHDNTWLAWHADHVPPTMAGIDAPPPPTIAQWKYGTVDASEVLSKWHLISVNELYRNPRRYGYFRQMEPKAVIAYSIYAYRLTDSDIERLLRDWARHDVESSASIGE